MSEKGRYVIRVRGHLASHWVDWFDNLAIDNEPNGEAVLSGDITDQAALHRVLSKIRDLGLLLISVNRIEVDERTGR